jgi:hypothetical protein
MSYGGKTVRPAAQFVGAIMHYAIRRKSTDSQGLNEFRNAEVRTNEHSVYQRFARWSRAQVWHMVFAELGGDADFEEVFMDSTIVRAHQHAAGAPQKKRSAIARSRGGLTTKIHALVDGSGMLALSPDRRPGRGQPRSSAFA